MIGGGKKTRRPVGWSGLWNPTWILDGDKCRQVLVFTSQGKCDPGAHTGKAFGSEPGRHDALTRAVRIGLGVQGMNKAEVIGQLRQVWRQVGDHFAAIAAWSELPQRPHHVSISALKRNQLLRVRQGLAVPFDQFRLEVKRIHLAQGSAAKHDNHIVSLRREMRWSALVGAGGCRFGHGSPSVGSEQGEQSNRTQAIERLSEEFTSHGGLWSRGHRFLLHPLLQFKNTNSFVLSSTRQTWFRPVASNRSQSRACYSASKKLAR